MSEWIEIDYNKNETRPKEGEIVLVYSAGTYYPPTVAYWECGYDFRTVYGDRRTCWNVTHWMPLPKLPKEKI